MQRVSLKVCAIGMGLLIGEPSLAQAEAPAAPGAKANDPVPPGATSPQNDSSPQSPEQKALPDPGTAASRPEAKGDEAAASSSSAAGATAPGATAPGATAPGATAPGATAPVPSDASQPAAPASPRVSPPAGSAAPAPSTQSGSGVAPYPGDASPPQTAASRAEATEASAAAGVAVKAPPAASPPAASPTESPAEPLRASFQLGLVLSGTWQTDTAHDYFAEDDLQRAVGVTLSADVWRFAPGFELFVGLDALHSSTDQSEVGGYVDRGEWDQTDLGGYVGARFALLEWLAPHVRVAGGASLIDTTLELRDEPLLERDEVLGYATLGAGVTLFSPAKRISRSRRYFNSIGLAAQIEGGYSLARNLEWTLPAIATGASQQVAVEATPLGTLERGGPFLRLALMARF